MQEVYIMFQYTTKIGLSYTNSDGKQSLRSALDLIIDCCYFQLPTEKKFHDFLKELNLGMFVIYRQLDLVRRPVYDEKVTIQTSIFDCKPMIGYRNTVIRDEAGNFCFKEYSLGAFVDFTTGKPARVPRELMDSLTYDPKIPMEYTPRKIELPDDSAFQFCFERKITGGFLDMNGHMNSNWYVSFAEECLPEDFSYNRVRVEYRKQAQKNDPVKLYSVFADSLFTVKICDANNDCFAVVEFSSAENTEPAVSC